MSSNTKLIEMPALGRSFQLGMLYNATKDKLIQGQELWDKDTIQNAVKDIPCIDPQFNIIADDSLSTKSQYLGANSNVKMNLLAGLVNVSGAAKFYNDYKSTKHAVRVSVHFKFLSKKQEIDIKQLGPIKDPGIISANSATHVVSRIHFGLEAFLIIDRPYSVEEKSKVTTIEENITDCAQSLAAMYDSVKTDVSVKVQEEAAKYHWTIYCDISLPTHPSNLKDVTSILKNDFLKFFKEGASCSKVFPKKVWLYPLSKLSSSTPTVHMISDSLIQQAERITANLYDTKVYLNDIIKNNTEVHCTVFQVQLSRLSSLIAQFQNYLKNQLSHMIANIRNNSMASSKLTNFLREIESKSPFGCSQLDFMKKDIDLEIRIISQYLQSLGSVEHVPYDQIYKFSAKFECIVCFEFRFSEINMASIDRMEEYLKSISGSAAPQSHVSAYRANSWYTDEAKKRKLQIKANIFKEFAQINSEKSDTAFIVTVISDPSSAFKDGARVILHTEDGLSKFNLPSQPVHLKFRKDIGHEVHLIWNKPKYGSQNVTSYVITYFPTNETGSIEDQVDLTVQTKHAVDSIVIKDLDPEQEYQFVVQAKCIAGLGPKSEILDRKIKFTEKPINSQSKSNKHISLTTAPTRRNKGSHQVTTTNSSRQEQKIMELELPPRSRSSFSVPSQHNSIKTGQSRGSKDAPIVLEFPPSLLDPKMAQFQLMPQRSKYKPVAETDASLLMQKISTTNQPS